MPRYDYRCESCGEQFEVVQSFNEPALTDCPHCGTSGLRKVFNSVGVVFKGSGFYRTDSREAGKKKAPAAKSAEAAGGSGKGSEKKPAADGGSASPNSSSTASGGGSKTTVAPASAGK